MLCRKRASGFAAPQALSYSEIEAYSRVTGRKLSPRQVEWIMTMDDWFLEAWSNAHQSAPVSQAPTHQVPLRRPDGTLTREAK